MCGDILLKIAVLKTIILGVGLRAANLMRVSTDIGELEGSDIFARGERMDGGRDARAEE